MMNSPADHEAGRNSYRAAGIPRRALSGAAAHQPAVCFRQTRQGSICVTAANSDDQESFLSIPVPLRASKAENLIDGSIIPIENGKINLTLPDNSSVVLKIRED